MQVCLAGVLHPAVDGTFTDDPGGYVQEHPAVQSAVQLTDGEIADLQLTDGEIADLQLGTQRAWTKTLRLLTKAGKYIPQVYRTTPPFEFNATAVSMVPSL